MSVGPWILARLSRSVAAERASARANPTLNPTNMLPSVALSQVLAAFPTFPKAIKDHTVLDYGCGTGRQAVAMVQLGARHVVGLELTDRSRRSADEHAACLGVADRVTFVATLQQMPIQQFDVVLTQNAMEHFANPAAALGEMAAALAPAGRLYVTFGPPWFAPYGGHMRFFTRMPWVTLLFRESTVMAVRARYRQDGFKRYADLEEGLNRMTVAQFERLVAAQDLRFVSRTYRGVMGMSLLTRVPRIRELFVVQVDCVLERSTDRHDQQRRTRIS